MAEEQKTFEILGVAEHEGSQLIHVDGAQGEAYAVHPSGATWAKIDFKKTKEDALDAAEGYPDDLKEMDLGANISSKIQKKYGDIEKAYGVYVQRENATPQDEMLVSDAARETRLEEEIAAIQESLEDFKDISSDLPYVRTYAGDGVGIGGIAYDGNTWVAFEYTQTEEQKKNEQYTIKTRKIGKDIPREMIANVLESADGEPEISAKDSTEVRKYYGETLDFTMPGKKNFFDHILGFAANATQLLADTSQQMNAAAGQVPFLQKAGVNPAVEDLYTDERKKAIVTHYIEVDYIKEAKPEEQFAKALAYANKHYGEIPLPVDIEAGQAFTLEEEGTTYGFNQQGHLFEWKEDKWQGVETKDGKYAGFAAEKFVEAEITDQPKKNGKVQDVPESVLGNKDYVVGTSLMGIGMAMFNSAVGKLMAFSGAAINIAQAFLDLTGNQDDKGEGENLGSQTRQALQMLTDWLNKQAGNEVIPELEAGINRG